MKFKSPKNSEGTPRLLAVMAASAVLCACFALSARTLIAAEGGTMFGGGGGDAIGSLPFTVPPEGLTAPISSPSIVLEGQSLARIQSVVLDAYGEGFAQAFDLGENGVRVELQGRVTLVLDRNAISLAGVTAALDVSQSFSSGLGIVSVNQRILRTQLLPAEGDLELPLKSLSESGALDTGVMNFHSVSVTQLHHRLDLSCSGGTMRLVSGN
ncbi:MAG TPA: hypothetical protein VM509_11245 [Planctomycetota bacterium]|nr:hypothetical protein [Planctomycetota bacterium]